MLSAENITCTVGSKKLLEDVSVRFEPGKLHLIIGPNGAGKSTLIKVLCKQLNPAEGKVFYSGKEVGTYSDAQLAEVRSVLSQNIELSFPLKVWEVVLMGRYPHFNGKPKAADETACKEAMDFFDVTDLADRNYMTLSGGEKQRVHFARVAAQVWFPAEGKARYLLLDEPLTFLDVHYQFQFMNKITEMLGKGDLVVVGVVHDLNLAAKFADTIVLLNKGKLMAAGSKKEVLTKDNIRAAYRLEPVIVEEKDGKGTYLFFQ